MKRINDFKDIIALIFIFLFFFGFPLVFVLHKWNKEDDMGRVVLLSLLAVSWFIWYLLFFSNIGNGNPLNLPW